MRKKRSPGFWRDEVWGRRKQILLDPAFWVALLLGVVTTLVAPLIPLGTLKVEELANYALLYSALSFGAAIAGAGIALGVPGDKRIKRWSTLIPRGAKYSSFQNLLFTFAWSAMAQIGLVLVSFLAIGIGTGYEVLPHRITVLSAPAHYIAVFLSFWLWWYALLELTAVVRIFMQVAGAIAKENVMNVDSEGDEVGGRRRGGAEVDPNAAKPSLLLLDD
jgi:hypothetical protein